MEGMNHSHDVPPMVGGMGQPPSQSSSMNATTGGMPMHHKMTMHMTFFWGMKAEILFHHWPGDHSGMYLLALLFVFVLAFLVEWLSYSRLINSDSNHVVSGLMQTLIHAVRIGLAYMVMLAVMSFNVGVFVVAVAGHTLGFLCFGSRVFRKLDPRKGFDLPPMRC